MIYQHINAKKGLTVRPFMTPRKGVMTPLGVMTPSLGTPDLRKQCDEMKAKLLKMENKIIKGDLGKEECLNMIDVRMK